MERKDLEMIISLYEHGNMVITAEELMCTQGAISIRLKKLEEELGITIFDRVGKKLVLSDKGKIVLDYALHEQREYVRLMNDLQESSSSISLKIGVVFPYVSTAISAINTIIKNHSNLQIQFYAEDSEKLLKMLYMNQIDIAIIIDIPNDLQTSLQSLKREDMKWKFFAHNESPLLKKDNISYHDLSNMKFVMSNNPYEKKVFDRLLELNGIKPNVFFTSNDVSSFLFLEYDESTIAILPELSLNYRIFTPLPLESEFLNFSFNVVKIKGRRFSKKIQIIIDELVDDLDKIVK